jgi:MoaA/NifB/PqqE/SkfB family radical SAM enzyme
MSIGPLASEPTPISEAHASEPEKRASRDHKRTTVRFTDEEFARILDEAKLAGISLPALLKLSHFKEKKLALLFPEDERHRVCTELRRIGNNVNQIARRVNSGALEGWHSEFREVATTLSKLCQMVAGIYGIR